MDVLDNNHIEYKREVYINQYHYFLDFVISINDRIIDLEIDGKQHLTTDAKLHDAIRDERVVNLGYEVYRVLWNEVNTQTGKEKMKEKIDNFIKFIKL